MYYLKKGREIIGGIDEHYWSEQYKVLTPEIVAKHLYTYRYDYYIGIDPDVDSIGFAVWYKPKKVITHVKSYSFFRLFEILKEWKKIKGHTIVHIEGAWLERKNNWHADNQRKNVGEAIAKKVGRNQQVGRQIVDMCIYLETDFFVRTVKKPLFQDEGVFKKVTGWQMASNKDSRSAANYVYGI